MTTNITPGGSVRDHRSADRYRLGDIHDTTGESEAPGRIVVGIDGSACSRSAAGWAAAEASRRGAPLLIVHVYRLPPVKSSGHHPYPPQLLAELREDGAALLQDTAAELRRAHPALRIDTVQSFGEPATVLRRTASGALLSVVGARGANGATDLGSVAAGVADDNPAPVALIGPGGYPSTGAVVVALTGAASDGDAVVFALQTAAHRQADLLAVHCVDENVPHEGFPPVPPFGADRPDVPGAGSQVSGDGIGEWFAQYPEVIVRHVSTSVAAEYALLDYAGPAQLIVTGSPDRGMAAGMLPAAIGRTLITHSSVPVVVVRPRSTD